MTTPSHVPVLLDRVVALLHAWRWTTTAPSSSTPPSASAATPRPSSAGCELGPGGRDRPRPRGAAAGGGAARAVRRPVHRGARDVRRDPRRPARTSASTTPTACCSTSASRRCSSTSPTAASPTARTRRSTCGWTRPPARPPPTSSTPTATAELTRVLREYGEERFASRIAAAIVRERDRSRSPPRPGWSSCSTTQIPAPARRTGGHPAKRTFQALRMEVNDELGVLRRAIPAAIDVLAVGGRVVVESYHSLEDRLVKQAFAAVTTRRRPAGPAVRPRRPRARPAPGHPRRRARRRRRDRRTTRAPPRSGCAPSNGSAPRGSTRQGSSLSMSSTAPALRARVPRLAGAALERARLTVVPRRRRRRTSPVPVPAGGLDDRGRRHRRAAALQHLDAAGVVRRDRPAAPGRHPAWPGSRRCRWSSTSCATRRRSRSRPSGWGWCCPTSPAVLDLRTGQRARPARPRRPRLDPLRLLAPPPAKPAELDPPAHVTVVAAARDRAHQDSRATPGTPRAPTARAPVDKAPRQHHAADTSHPRPAHH